MSLKGDMRDCGDGSRSKQEQEVNLSTLLTVAEGYLVLSNASRIQGRGTCGFALPCVRERVVKDGRSW